MNQGLPPWTDTIGSPALIKKLLAFTKAKMAFRPWANGGLPKGYLFTDVVQDAITIYLKDFLHDIAHHPTESEIEKSLQKMIVNRLKVLSELTDNRYSLVDSRSVENEYFPEQRNSFDHESFEAHVFEILENEPELWSLFSGLYFIESSRAELIEQFQISANDYDNRARRLRRKIAPLLNIHNIHRYGKIREKSSSSPGRACLELVQQG